MPDTKNCDWFSDWFDSPYYHLLYSERDETEAEKFIRTLAGKLAMPAGSEVLDLACGRGRHAVTLNRLGMSVTGLDLSPENIAYAKKSENASLVFYEHDMRRPFRSNYFDYVLNLFTSFGYFEHIRDNEKVIDSVHKSLKPGGIFVLDFFNGIKVAEILQQEHRFEKEAGGVRFDIRKYIRSGKVCKEIRFTDRGHDFFFTEMVQLLTPADFRRLLEPHFKILHLSGNYGLGPFDEKESDRFIIIAEKISGK
ncbi:MAG: type 11 methyltransferase [Bacteroidetes bacterium]|nr:MAG: type 11 methyltransferase [Bacteroidota bacterium]